jgi:lysozyme
MKRNMKTSSNGRKLIEGFEGLILQAYDDHNDKIVPVGEKPIGTLTIGYGHTGADVHVGDKIMQAQADALLSKDLASAEKDVSSLVKAPINQNQFDALVSFQFNTGALGHSSALPLINSSNFTEAADHLTLYNMAGGQVLPGLVRRRAAEKALFLTSAPVNTVNGPLAGTAVVVAGAAAASQSSSPELFWIIMGIVTFGAIIIALLVHEYSNTPQITKVN